MSPETRFGQQLWRGVALACVLGLFVAGGLWWTLKDTGIKTVVAYFPTAIGLYEDNTVRVRGVEMGRVDKVEPEGDRVKVTLKYDRTVAIPADAQAVIVAPSLVSDRFVQLTPAYSGSGDIMADAAVISEERTAVPLEVDDLYETLIEVSETLGPDGANADGELSELLDTLADNVKGNGQALNATINKLGKASGTLEGNSDDLFATVTNLAKFTKTLAGSDADIREFQRRLADVSSFLSDERHSLSSTVKELGPTLAKVRKFVDDNRDSLRSNVDKLSSVTKSLADERAALAEILDVAPVALSNVIETYNGGTGALDTRANLNELGRPPLVMLCQLLRDTNEGLGELADVCSSLEPLGKNLPSVAETVHSLGHGEIPLPIAEMMQVQQGGAS